MTLTNIIQFLLVVIEKSMPVSFLSAVYNGEISLKEAEISQRKMEEKIEELRGYRPENAERDEISGVLMQATDMFLEYRKKIIEAFRDGTFLSEHLKKSDDAAYNHVLENIINFIQKIESMAEKINLSLFENLFGSPSTADYAKMLTILRIQMKTKKL